MNIRRVLQIILGLLVASIVVLGGLIIYQLTREPSTVVVRNVQGAAEETTREPRNKWEGKQDEAIQLVRQEPIGTLDDETRAQVEASEDLTVEDLVQHEWFVQHRLQASNFEPSGWSAQWWGETKYGDSYYRVRYGFRDEEITVGPMWLVDLERDQVVPKNLPARVVTSPAEGMDSEYYDKSKEVVSAMTRHTFDSGLTLAGALLLYFERRTDDQNDKLLGWTIQHNRDALFTAYFQWREDGEPIYAEFDFDYDRRALKAVNLHAASIMRRGEQFESEKQPVDILPKHYEPDARRAIERWTGPAREQYEDPDNRDYFKALDAVLSENEMIDALEWLLRVRAKTPEQFEVCKKERNCKWKPEERDEGGFRVTYIYNLGEGEQTIAWNVDLEEERIEPVDRISRLAYRVVYPRSQ